MGFENGNICIYLGARIVFVSRPLQRVSAYKMNVVCLLLALFLCPLTHTEHVSTGINLLAQDVFKHARYNIHGAPFVWHAGLSLLYEGASGETEKLMRDVLRLPSKEETAEQYRRLMDLLSRPSNVTVKVAHKLYVRPTDIIKKSFQNVAVNNFHAEIARGDFATIRYKDIALQSDTEKQPVTGPALVPNVEESTRAILSSTFYFDGKWGVPFNTINKTWWNGPQYKVDNHPFIQTSGQFSISTSRKLDAQILKLPYLDERYSMVLMLPNKKYEIDELYKKLSRVNILPYLKEFKTAQTLVTIPKFDESEPGTILNLKWPTMNLGLTDIFDGKKANFSEIVDNPEELHIDEYWENIRISIDEEGTQLAVSEAGSIGELRSLTDEIHFEADHPFLYFITAKLEGNPDDVILFMASKNYVQSPLPFWP